ncbi:MAG TPA: NAD(P)H-dependent oxidoreductase subunit E [Actinomycetota bacterium]
MDLRLIAAEPTEDEREAVDAVLGAPESGWEGGERTRLDGHVARGGRAQRERRHLLLPALQALQRRAGWITDGGMGYVCRRLSIPPADAYGVASFYALLSTEPRPRIVLHVCDDVACRVGGGPELLDRMRAAAGPDRAGHVVPSPCLGLCDRAPAAMVQLASKRGGHLQVAPADEGLLRPFIDGGSWALPHGSGRLPQLDDGRRDGLRLLRGIGRSTEQEAEDPQGPRERLSLERYRARGGSAALERAIELGPERVIAEVKTSKLLGRGGAAFPTGVKWEAVAGQAARPHYFVCNADESEPGTFKDRVLMEEDPLAIVEAITVAGFATGAQRGYVYVRGEYPVATRRLENAIAEARGAGLLGEDVLGSGFSFDIEVRVGAGAYIAGEETALFNSIEGYRPEPRNKPPFPVERGLFGKPTGINNVETLLNVLEVLRIGGEEFAGIGTEGSTGTRLFCLSGCVEEPGLYEVEFGATLRDLLELAGGIRGGRGLRAVLLGGAAGTFVGPDDLDIRLTFEDARAGGYTLGSGVVCAFDDTIDMADIVLRIAAFFRDESCGQCVPCRVGTVRQEEALHRLHAGRAFGSVDQETALLGDIAAGMRDASICGLGQTAASAVMSALKLGLFPTGAAR